MTVLQALERHYHQLDERGEGSPQGWGLQKFGWCVVLNRSGVPVEVQDLRGHRGQAPKLQSYAVPAAVTRTNGIAPNMLWDKTAYALGRTAGKGRRTAQEHAAFVSAHLVQLAEHDDEGLVALRWFVERWNPEHFDKAPFRQEMLDANVMFRLEGDVGFLHERAAARALVDAARIALEEQSIARGQCLVAGREAQLARLHPVIKGVEGGQASGAALVSFNLDAFTSLGKEQGANAPTSQGAAWRYGAALNHLLRRDGPNRLRRPVGDATVVVWAQSAEARVAAAAERLMGRWLGEDNLVDPAQAANLRRQMAQVATGCDLAELNPELAPGTQIHVLGLSPNAARISVRFWMTGSLEAFARRLARHHEDWRIEPLPVNWGDAPSINRLLANATAFQGDDRNVSPLLAGEVMRAVLSGTDYPQILLSSALMRLRAGDNAGDGWYAAAIRAVLVRMRRRDPEVAGPEEMPVGLDTERAVPGYLLGRLFATYERAQRAARGRVNTTIRDTYFASASATPARVFPVLVRGGQNHLAMIRQYRPSFAGLITRELEQIHGQLGPLLPRWLGLVQQGEFAIGYYHQRATKLGDETGKTLASDEDADMIHAAPYSDTGGER